MFRLTGVGFSNKTSKICNKETSKPLMNHIPRVLRYASCPNWIGVFYTFDATAGAWRMVRKSTKCPTKGGAMAIVHEWQRLANLAAGGEHSTMTREYALESVNLILRAAGLPPVVDTETWATYAPAWLAMRAKGTAERTHEAYKSHLATFAKWLGPRAKWGLAKFDGMLMQKFYDELVDAGRSPKTAKNILKTVAMVFERARAEGLCPRNPAELVERRHGGDVERVREVFSREDQRKIVEWLTARRSDPVMADWLTMTYLGAATGRRLMDCAAAAWTDFEDIRPDLLVWTLRPQKSRRTGKVERVPIIGPAVAHLRSLRHVAPAATCRSELLCPALTGRSKLSGDYIAILRSAGVEVGTVPARGAAGNEWTTKGFHSWRHTVTSRLAEGGVDQRVGMRVTGHSSQKVHAGYTHLEVTALAEAMQRAL